MRSSPTMNSFSTPISMRSPLATAALLLLFKTDTVCAAGFGEPGRELWMWHGILMFIAWGIVFPVGSLLAVYRRQVGETGDCLRWAPNFYPPHLYCQMFGIALNIIAVGLGAAGSFEVYGTGNPFEPVLWDFNPRFFEWNYHVRWGVATLAIMVGQSILGYVHHLIKHRYDVEAQRTKDRGGQARPWKRWIVPSWAHVIFGPLAVITSYLTIVQGFQIWAVIFEGDRLRADEGVSGYIQFGYAAVGIVGVAFFGAYALGKHYNYKEVKSDEECMKAKAERGTAV